MKKTHGGWVDLGAIGLAGNAWESTARVLRAGPSASVTRPEWERACKGAIRAHNQMAADSAREGNALMVRIHETFAAAYLTAFGY